MKKANLIQTLNSQIVLTKKNTRKDIVAMVRDMVAYHIKDNAEITGLSATRSNTGLNLGEVVEIVLKSIHRNKLAKAQSNAKCDLIAKGEKVEAKFITCDAYAHPINPREVVDYYLLVTYSKKFGGQVFKVPYANRDEIVVNNQGRVTLDQKVKFLDKELTERLFAF